MMKKRILSLVLSTLMLLALLPAGMLAFAAGDNFSITYDVGGVEVEAPVGESLAVGTEFYLTNDLSGAVYEKDGYNVVFYGWKIDGKLMHAGDFVEMPVGGLTATAVWAVIAAVDPNATEAGMVGDIDAPFADFFDAVVALKAFDKTNVEAVAVYFVGNQEVDVAKYGALEDDEHLVKSSKNWADSKGVFHITSSGSYVMYDVMLKPLGLPVMFTADQASTTVKFDNKFEGTQFFHFGFEDYAFIDGVKLQFVTDINTRFFFKKGGGIGLNGVFTCNQTMYMQMASTAVDAEFRFYNSTVGYLYLGFASGSLFPTHHVYLAHNFTVGTIVLNNIKSTNDTYVDIHAGAEVTKVQYSYMGDGYNCSGLFDVTVHKGANDDGSKILNVYDYYKNSWTQPHCTDLKKVLTFDGFEGAVNYYHIADTANANPNGLDAIYFVNGASVKFANTDVCVEAAGGGVVYFDETSSLQNGSLGIVGVSDDGTAETKTALVLPSFGGEIFRGFNGSTWNAGYTLNYVTGYNGLTIDPVLFASDIRHVLPNDLRHVTMTDENGIEVGFYGWDVEGAFHFAGETIDLGGCSVIATAVWVPILHVGASDDATAMYNSLETVWENYPGYMAGIICFEENYTWDISGFAHPSGRHEPLFAARTKPVLFVGKTNEVQLNLQDFDEGASATKGAFYYGFESFVGFDGLTLTRQGRDVTAGRLTPRAGMYFGPDYRYVVTHSKQTLGLDAMASKSSVEYFVFGGDWGFVYTNAQSGDQDRTHRVFIGGKTTAIGTIALNNIHSYSSDYVQIDGGAVDVLKFASLDSLNDPAGKINRGKFIVTLRGGNVKNIYDHNGAETNNGSKAVNNRTNKFCWDLERTLIFDGYTGSITYSHMTTYLPDGQGSATPAEFYPNGLDNLILKNGSNVTFKGHSVHMKAKNTATVYVSEDSVLTGNVVGVATIPTDDTPNVVGDDSNATLLEIAVGKFTEWDGSAAESYSLDDAVRALGVSIRLESPYGIRFGYEFNQLAYEHVTGLEVVSKGALLIPAAILGDKELTRDVADALDVACTVALSEAEPNRYNVILVDSREDSDAAWLKAWKGVDFVSRSYIELSDGTTIYSVETERSIEYVANELNIDLDNDIIR